MQSNEESFPLTTAEKALLTHIREIEPGAIYTHLFNTLGNSILCSVPESDLHPERCTPGPPLCSAWYAMLDLLDLFRRLESERLCGAGE